MNFFKKSHFALFGLFGIYAKDTKFINGTHTTHREKYKCTQTHAHTDTDTIFTFYFLDHLAYMPKILISHLAHPTHTDTHRLMHTYRYHFYILHFLAHLAYIPKIFGIPQNYTCTDTQICPHMYRDINTQIQIH